MNLYRLSRVIQGKRYRTETATEVASNVWWNGQNHEQHGTNCWLLRTPKGRFFEQFQTLWDGQPHRITPLSREAAMALYEALPTHVLTYEEAFGVEPEDA